MEGRGELRGLQKTDVSDFSLLGVTAFLNGQCNYVLFLLLCLI